MKITRFFTGSDNESHFEEIEINTDQAGNPYRNGELIKAAGLLLRESGPPTGSQSARFHQVSRRQFGIILKGELEIEVGDGTKHRFEPGNMFLAEDTTGHGHRTRSTGNEDVNILFIPLS